MTSSGPLPKPPNDGPMVHCYRSGHFPFCPSAAGYPTPVALCRVTCCVFVKAAGFHTWLFIDHRLATTVADRGRLEQGDHRGTTLTPHRHHSNTNRHHPPTEHLYIGTIRIPHRHHLGTISAPFRHRTGTLGRSLPILPVQYPSLKTGWMSPIKITLAGHEDIKY